MGPNGTSVDTRCVDALGFHPEEELRVICSVHWVEWCPLPGFWERRSVQGDGKGFWCARKEVLVAQDRIAFVDEDLAVSDKVGIWRLWNLFVIDVDRRLEAEIEASCFSADSVTHEQIGSLLKSGVLNQNIWRSNQTRIGRSPHCRRRRVLRKLEVWGFYESTELKLKLNSAGKVGAELQGID